MSETPRTDAVERHVLDEDPTAHAHGVADALNEALAFARTLERENAALRKACGEAYAYIMRVRGLTLPIPAIRELNMAERELRPYAPARVETEGEG